MRTLILNSSNILPNTNNSIMKYTFPAGNLTFRHGQKLALASLSMYYSTFNITALNNNNKINYIWVDNTEIAITIPDGFYTIDLLNDYIHQQMIYNGHYLVNNSSGQYVYFITLGSNLSSYTFQLNCFPMNSTTYPTIIVPPATTSAYSVGTKQAGSIAPVWEVPTANIVPMLRVLNNKMVDTIGFSAGYYPTGSPTLAPLPATIDTTTLPPPAQTQTPTYSVVQSYLSDLVPQITPLSSFVMTCSLLNNNYAVPNTLLYAFSPVGEFAQQFTIQPTGQFSFIDIQPGQYGGFTIQFLDQNLFPIAIQDPNMVVLLVITDPDEGTMK